MLSNMEAEIQQSPRETGSFHAILGHFPEHVKKDWYTPPSKLKPKAVFDTKSPEEHIKEASKITDAELERLQTLSKKEAQYQDTLHAMSGDEQQRYLKETYEAMRSKKNTPERTLDALALSITAIKTVYKPKNQESPAHGEIADLTMTQRVALLRAVGALEKNDSQGLVEILRSGLGKTNILIPTLLPVALLFREHWDVLSLTDTSQRMGFTRFKNVARCFDIPVASFKGNGIEKWYNNGRHTISIDKTLIHNVMTQRGVVFSERSHIAHLSERDPDLLYESNPKKNGLIQDEIDAVFDTGSRYVISGKNEKTNTVIDRYWTIMDRETQPDLDPQKMEKVVAWLNRGTPAEKTTAEKAVTLLSKSHEYDANAVMVTSLLYEFFDHERQLDPKYTDALRAGRHTKQLDKKSLTPLGEYDVFRRMYSDMMATPYDETVLMPEEWHTFFETLFPPHVMESIQSALAVEGTYFVKDGAIILKNKETGYPLPNNSYQPLVTACLYVRESLQHPDMKMTQFLQEVQDSMTPSEIIPLRYSMVFGFTGTGIDQATLFQQIHGLETTIIPPQYEDHVTVEEIRTVKSQIHVYREIETIIRARGGDTSPILIDVASEQEKEELHAYLQSRFKDTYAVTALSAKNAEEANTIFENAGKKNELTIVLRMAGREVDIPVEDESNATTGLTVISTSPHKLSANQEQLMRRTGRNGHPGTFIQITNPDNELYQELSIDDQHNVRKAIENHDRKKVAYYIEKAQDIYREKVAQQNIMTQAEFGHFVRIRTKLAQLPEASRKAILSVWRDFQVMTQTLGAFVPFHNPREFENMGEKERFLWWQTKVNALFDSLVAVSMGPDFQSHAEDLFHDFQVGEAKRIKYDLPDELYGEWPERKLRNRPVIPQGLFKRID